MFLKHCFIYAVLSLPSFLFPSASFAIAEKDTGNLGEIRYSVLSQQNFQRIYGDGWVPMNGADITHSDLFKEGLWETQNLPDTRGRFLRCSNTGRDTAQGNPDGDLPVGTYQADELKSHNHSVTRRMGFDQGGGQLHDSEWKGDTQRDTNFCTSDTGGNETRPRCVIVNTFIKVNRTPESQELNKILKAISAIPGKILSSESFKQVIQRLRPSTGGTQPVAPNPAALPSS